MKNASRVAIWLAWLVVVAALGWAVARHLRISSDLRDFVPPARTADQALLLDEIGRGPGSRLLLLAVSGAPPAQLAAVSQYFDQLAQHGDRMPALQPGDNEKVVVETVQ